MSLIHRFKAINGFVDTPVISLLRRSVSYTNPQAVVGRLHSRLDGKIRLAQVNGIHHLVGWSFLVKEAGHEVNFIDLHDSKIDVLPHPVCPIRTAY